MDYPLCCVPQGVNDVNYINIPGDFFKQNSSILTLSFDVATLTQQLNTYQ